MKEVEFSSAVKPPVAYSGVVVPMVTPLNDAFDVDVDAVDRIIHRLLDAGTFPFVLGTTGEAALIPDATKLKLVRHVGKQFSHKTLLYGGISANSLGDAINNGKVCADQGIHVAVASPPSGYPLAVDDQFRFFHQLADRLPIPLIIYNIPHTTHTSLDLHAIDKLSHHPNIVGIKDSEANAARQQWALNHWRGRTDFRYFAGSSSTSAQSLMNGGSGIVPSSGNLVPDLYQKLFLAATAGDAIAALQYQSITDRITRIYAEDKKLYSSLPSLKAMMELAGLCSSLVMPPYEKVSHDERCRLKTQMMNDPYLKSLLD